jgi:hypothetical protein
VTPVHYGCMPTTSRRENAFIEFFIREYDGKLWANGVRDWLDERQDGAVEVIVTGEDGTQLAIEHTLIEFFLGEREDQARFRQTIYPIEQDESLVVPERITYVYAPRGCLQTGSLWSAVATELHSWLRKNTALLPIGKSTQMCGDVMLRAEVVPVSGDPGDLIIRRYGDVNIGESVEQALQRKLPKLLRTPATKRILMLERSQFALDEREIMAEVDRRRGAFPGLALVDVWIVETPFYDTMESAGWRGYIEFKRYVGDEIVESMGFNHGKLVNRSENGIAMNV